MLFMLFLRLRVDDDVVNENDNKLIQILHETLILELHEGGRSICDAERHDGVLI
jgi:hypothetical protein